MHIARHRNGTPSNSRTCNASPAAALPTVEALESRRLFSVAYTITDLGSLAGFKDFTATGLNNVGQVVGYAGKSDVYYDTRGLQGFVYRGGVLQTIGGKDSTANAINDKGQVVGSFQAGGYLHPYMTVNGAMKDLYPIAVGSAEPYTPSYSIAHAINNAGQVAGETIDTSVGDQAAWMYAGGTTRYLNGGSNDAALAINNSGVVAGYSGSLMFARGFRASSASPQSLGVLGGQLGASTAFAINDAGLIAGQSDRMDSEFNPLPPHATLYTNGTLNDLGALNAGADSAAHGLNNQGIVVGSSAGHAFVFRNGKMIDLNSLVSRKSGLVLTDAVGVNNHGAIAVNGTIAGHSHAFLLRPVETGAVSGRFFLDLNHDRKRQTNEGGLSNWQVYLDSNLNGRWDAGEATTVTDGAGNYTFSGLASGKNRVRAVTYAGWIRTQPGGNETLGFYDVNVSSGTVAGIDFGNYRK